MTQLLRAHMNQPGQAKKTPFLVVMSDMDEIPSHHTLNLLKACDFGSKIHLQLRNFLYRSVKRNLLLYKRACVDALKKKTVLNGTLALQAGEQAFTCGTPCRITGIPRAPKPFWPIPAGIAATASELYLNMLSR